MTAIRILLALGGLWLGWHGLTLLFELPRPDLISAVLWFAAAILLHDGVFAPLCAATGVTARRWLPAAWWAPVACGAVCTAALLLIGIPVLGRGDAVADNPTVLDRRYPLGIAAAIVIVWALVLAADAARRRRGGRTPDPAHPTGRTP